MLTVGKSSQVNSGMIHLVWYANYGYTIIRSTHSCVYLKNERKSTIHQTWYLCGKRLKHICLRRFPHKYHVRYTIDLRPFFRKTNCLRHFPHKYHIWYTVDLRSFFRKTNCLRRFPHKYHVWYTVDLRSFFRKTNCLRRFPHKYHAPTKPARVSNHGVSSRHRNSFLKPAITTRGP